MQSEQNLLSWKTATGPIEFPLTNDLMFHIMLQRNEDILQSLISSMLHIPLEDIISTHVENPFVFNDSLFTKLMVLDIKVTLNDSRIIDLEMQVANEDNWTDRSLAYLCRNFDNVAKGRDYVDVTPVNHIGFLAFDLFPNYPEFYSNYKMLNVKNGNVFNDKFTLAVLSLNQIELATEEDKQWEIDKWATIFKAKTWEELQMAATTTTLEKVADSIFVQNTDEQIRYAMFKKQEAEAHEKRLKSELAQQQSIIDEQKTQLDLKQSQLDMQKSQLDMQKSQLDERDRTIELLQAEIKALKGEN